MEKLPEVKLLSRVRLFATSWTVAHQAPLSVEFSRQEYWSGLSFPFSRGSSRPRNRTRVSRIAKENRCFTVSVTREAKVEAAQSCLTLCDPMDYRAHGILQARVLEWVAVAFSRGSSQPRDQSQVSCIAGGFFTR